MPSAASLRSRPKRVLAATLLDTFGRDRLEDRIEEPGIRQQLAIILRTDREDLPGIAADETGDLAVGVVGALHVAQRIAQEPEGIDAPADQRQRMWTGHPHWGKGCSCHLFLLSAASTAPPNWLR